MRRVSVLGISNARRTAAADRLSRRTAGRATAINTSIGGATATASASARRRASAFRHQLAGHHVKVSDERKTQNHGGHVAVDLRVRQRAHPSRREICAASGSPSQPSASEQSVTPSCTAGRRSSRLRCSRRTARAPGTRAAQQLLHARVANGNQRELSRHKIGVGQNQQGHGHRLEQQELVHLAVRIALDRRATQPRELFQITMELPGTRPLRRTYSGGGMRIANEAILCGTVVYWWRWRPLRRFQLCAAER